MISSKELNTFQTVQLNFSKSPSSFNWYLQSVYRRLLTIE